MDSISISAIIIDDDPDAINLLEMYLRQFPFIIVKGKETNPMKGLELVMETFPELVFLDIDMPDMNGLQVANNIHAENNYSEIIFTTAHQHYAYDALGVEPLDFLTKPFCAEDIESVIQKFREKSEKKKIEEKLDKFIHSQTDSTKLKLPTTQGVLIVEIKDIMLLRSKGNNCNMYLSDGAMETITRNIYIIVQMLNSPAFFQISRSAYINTNYLKRVDKKKYKCILGFNNTTHEEPISRSQMSIFEKQNLFPNIEL